MPYRKLHAVLASLALLAFASALFSPALFQGKILAPLDITKTLISPWSETANGAKPHNHNPSDAVTQYLPYRMFAEKSLKEDGYIGWNPYEMGGYSLAANTMALPGTWTMQLHRFLAFKDAWNLGIFAEFLIAGFGMLVFLRSRKLPWLPCLIGTVAFMFNAQFITWIYHRWALGSFCWMPWVLWACGEGFSSQPLPRRIYLLAPFIALAFLGGSLQHVAFVVLACGCMVAGKFNFRRPLSNSSTLFGWAGFMTLACGIAAFSLVPQVQGYLSNIAIGHIRGGIGYEEGISQPLLHLLLIPARIWPWLAGDPQSLDALRLLKSGFMEWNFIGTIPMLLGLVGLFVPGLPRTAKWLIVTGLIIPLTPLVGPLYHRVELLFILGAAWMTAEMLNHLNQSNIVPQSGTKTDRQSLPSSLASCVSLKWQRLLIIAVAIIGSFLLIGTCLPAGLRSEIENQVVTKALARSGESQFGADQTWIAARAREWTSRFSLIHPRTAWIYGLLVLGSTGLILATSGNPSVVGVSHSSARSSQPTTLTRISAGQLMILCATSMELATLFQTWTTFSDPSDLHPKSAVIETVRSLAGPHRVLQSTSHASIAEVFAAPNLLAAQSIPSIDAYESIQYRSSLTATHGNPDDLRLTLAGVGLAIQPASHPQPGTESWPVSATLGSYILRRNPTIPPPIAAGHGTRPITPAAIGTALPESTSVRPSLQTPNRWAFEIPVEKSWIRIAQNWHEGWKWRSSGMDWQPFINGPDACCWIDNLPTSTHHIDVQFFPRPQWLEFTSLITAIAWLCLFLVASVYSSAIASAKVDDRRKLFPRP